uniref:SH3 and PX domains 2A n=1 Tax=Loxodonta africana TaxID=9785 RepID=G3UNE3_LOXAF
AGWWFVSTSEEQGWVPATYLEAQNGTRDDSDINTSKTGEEEKYITVQPYTSQSKDEIGFEKGVTVEVIRKNLEGWWYIRYLGKEGWAPASYLKKAKDDLPARKKNLAGPVEIIGNIMEISNLLNKKASGDKDTPPGSPNLRTRPPPRRESSLAESVNLLHHPGAPQRSVFPSVIQELETIQTKAIPSTGGIGHKVIDKNSGGWWYVQIGEKEGWAPASYIDKRKKPNLNRRTSTLTRPKVPPPAPPSKPKEAEEGLVGSSESQDSPLKLKYEEPEYDIPAFGFDSEPELNEEPTEDSSSGDRRPTQPHRPSPASSLQRARFKVGESSEDVALEEETIYENEGFRPCAEDALSARGSSGDSDSPGGSSLSLARKNSPKSGSPKSSSLLKLKAEKNAQAELGKNHSTLSKNSGDLKPRSASDAGIRGTPKVGTRKDADLKAGLSSCARAKPSVRPKPFLNRAESQSQEKMDISTLRRQLRPTGQLRGGLRGSKSEDSELPPVLASEGPSEGARRGSADLITLPVATPPCPTKTSSAGVVKMRNGVRQAAVRPQSVFVSPPPKDNNLSCALRRNESLTATDSLRGVRRNSSFSTARSAAAEAKGRLAERAASQGSDAPLLSTQRNGIPVSPVRPKPIEKSQFIHNNLKDVYVSIADYEGDEETAGFQEGVSMEVLERNPNGWWYCQILDGVKPFKGWVPSNYLEKKN